MKTSIIIAILFFSLSSYSQTEFGVVSGINSSAQKLSTNHSLRIYINPDYTFTVDPVRGFFYGISVNTRLGKNTDFRSMILYSSKGQFEQQIRKGISGGFTFKDRLKYLEIPLNFVFDLGGRSREGLFFSMGGYLAKALSGSSVNKNLDVGVSTNEEVKIAKTVTDWKGGTLYIKKYDIGVNLGIGFRAKNFLFEMNRAWGITNNIPQVSNPTPNSLGFDSNKATRRTRNWSIGVTYYAFKKYRKANVDSNSRQDNKRLQFGFKVGPSLSKFRNNDVFDIYESRIGLRGGVQILWTLRPKLRLRPEFIYAIDKIAYKSSGTTFHLNRVSMPLLINYGFTSKISVELGPEFVYLLSVGSSDSNIAKGIDQMLLDRDYGLTFGMECRMTRRIGLSVRNYIGLRELSTRNRYNLNGQYLGTDKFNKSGVGSLFFNYYL